MYDWSEEIKEYQTVVTLSDFSRDEIKRKWGVNARVISPAIDINQFHVGAKEKQILSVGRFFEVEGGNNKNHEIMIEAFKKLPKDWKLIFVGSIQNQTYYDRIVEKAKGLNIEFKHDIPFTELVSLYAESSHLWHAAGYKAKDPSECEHFGIVAIEALASGCQPIVYDAGGISQIKGVEVWHDIDELAEKTQQAVNIPKIVEYSRDYDLPIFEKEWRSLINA
jgi:glycosyltransferase involved in cell wall biosynthesis